LSNKEDAQLAAELAAELAAHLRPCIYILSIKNNGNIRDWFERKAYLARGSPLFPPFQTIFCFRLLQEQHGHA